VKPLCVLFIPVKYYFNKKHIPYRIKFHILSLLSHISDIADIKVFDLEIRFGNPDTRQSIELFKARVKQLLLNQNMKPDVIGISCYTSFDYLGSIDLVKLSGSLYPDAIKVVGGNHPTACPEDFTRSDLNIDYIIKGEGEIALREIILSGKREQNKIIDGKALDLSNEMELRYDLYPYKSEDVLVSLSRGCPFKCSFCVQSDDYENRYRSHSFDRIKELINSVTRQMPVKRIMFNDAFFGKNNDQANEIIEFLSKEYPDLNYWIETRVDRVNQDWFKNLPKLKMEIFIGVESLAPSTLTRMGKSKRPEKYIHDFYNLIELSQQQEVNLRLGFIMNFPGESYESYHTTLYHLNNVVKGRKNINFSFNCNRYTLYPGNKIYNQRHDIQKSTGYTFYNEGWWAVEKENILERCVQSIASESIKAAYGNNPDFWKEPVNNIQKQYYNKFSFKTFCHFENFNVINELRQHYKTFDIQIYDDLRYEGHVHILQKLNFVSGSIKRMYEKWLNKNFPVYKATFFLIYNKTITDKKHVLLDMIDNKMPWKDIMQHCESFANMLEQELEYNCRIEQGHDFSFRVGGNEFLCNKEGKLLQKVANQ
jgi:radical SAM superfamily enzyme YgiQ (UPF0313 family)